MSSHHFVKDQQEPAVWIVSAEGVSLNQIAPMLEWIPTVLVNEFAVEQVLTWGIKIDLILASEDFQKANDSILQEQFPLKFLTESDPKSLNQGIEYLLNTAHKAVHLVGISHLQAFKLPAQISQLDLTIVDGDWKYYPVKSGVFRKWFAETTIHLHAKEGQPIEIRNSNGTLILSITYATMIEVPEGRTKLKSSGVFWIGEMMS